MIYASEFTPAFLKLLGKFDKQVKERVLGHSRKFSRILEEVRG